MIKYSKPSKYDLCLCGNDPVINMNFGYVPYMDNQVTVSLCNYCFGELGTDADVLETFGVDALLNKEVK